MKYSLVLLVTWMATDLLPSSAQKPELYWGVDLSEYGDLNKQGFVEATPGTLFATTAECKLLMINSTNGNVISEYQMPGNSDCGQTFKSPTFNEPINTYDDVVVFYSQSGGGIAGVNYDGSERFVTSVQGQIMNMMVSPSLAAVAVAHNTPDATISYISVADGALLGSATVEGETVGQISRYQDTGVTGASETYWFYGVASGDLYEVNVDSAAQPSITNLGNIGNPGYPSGPAAVKFGNSPYSVYMSTAEKTTQTDPNPSIYHYEVPYGSSIEVGKHRSSIPLDGYIDGPMISYEATNEYGVCFAFGATDMECRTSTLELRWSKFISSGFTNGMPGRFSTSTKPGTILANDLLASKGIQGLSIDDGEELWRIECSDLEVLSLGVDCGKGNLGGYIALDRYDDGSFFYSIEGGFLIKATISDISEQPTLVPTQSPSTLPTEPVPTSSTSPTGVPNVNPTASPTGSGKEEDEELENRLEGLEIAVIVIGCIIGLVLGWLLYQKMTEPNEDGTGGEGQEMTEPNEADAGGEAAAA